jgi:hypothetical protein
MFMRHDVQEKHMILHSPEAGGNHQHGELIDRPVIERARSILAQGELSA